MALILNIDTALETASVSISKNGKIVAAITNKVQKEHASFLHISIETLQQQTGISLQDLDAIAVTEGPGSYTGLRVGMASAKGLSYALNKPLINVGTLTAMAKTAITANYEDAFYVPLIDARRLEVFTAVYTQTLDEILSPTAMILDEHSFSTQLSLKKTIFFGNGMPKWKSLIINDNAAFMDIDEIAEAISMIAEEKYLQKEFANIAHSEPLYIKEFYNGK